MRYGAEIRKLSHTNWVFTLGKRKAVEDTEVVSTGRHLRPPADVLTQSGLTQVLCEWSQQPKGAVEGNKGRARPWTHPHGTRELSEGAIG